MFLLRTGSLIGILVFACGPAVYCQGPAPAARSEAVVLRVGTSQTVAMKSKKTIRSARSSNEAIVRIGGDDKDPKVVVLTGLQPGVSRLTLRDVDGGEETLLLAIEGANAQEARPGGAMGVRQEAVKALREAMRNERSIGTRLIMAESLIRIAPDDAGAAQELVDALLADHETLPADAYVAMERVMPTAPPALVEALIPLLRHREEIHRRRAALLLSKIEPQLAPVPMGRNNQ